MSSYLWNYNEITTYLGGYIMKINHLSRNFFCHLTLFLLCLSLLFSTAACYPYVGSVDEPESTTAAETESPENPCDDTFPPQVKD
jgi:hypothetical protein